MMRRDEPAFRALRHALHVENMGPPHGIYRCWECPNDLRLEVAEEGLLMTVALDLLDQLRVMTEAEVESVRAHLHRPLRNRPEHSFMVYISFRDGSWGILHASMEPLDAMPPWFIATAEGTVSSRGQIAEVEFAGEKISYETPSESDVFWTNLYEAIREGAPLNCPPFAIARAMKLWEAAIESAESGEPVTI